MRGNYPCNEIYLCITYTSGRCDEIKTRMYKNRPRCEGLMRVCVSAVQLYVHRLYIRRLTVIVRPDENRTYTWRKCRERERTSYTNYYKFPTWHRRRDFLNSGTRYFHAIGIYLYLPIYYILLIFSFPRDIAFILLLLYRVPYIYIYGHIYIYDRMGFLSDDSLRLKIIEMPLVVDAINARARASEQTVDPDAMYTIAPCTHVTIKLHHRPIAALQVYII